MIKESPVKGLASVLTCLLLAVYYFVPRLASMRLLREPFRICDFIFNIPWARHACKRIFIAPDSPSPAFDFVRRYIIVGSFFFVFVITYV